MARPKLYDDTELLGIMAELLAWPESTGVTEPTTAARQAIALILEAEHWDQSVVDQTKDRLIKAFRTGGEERIAAARAGAATRPPWLQGPMLPGLLTRPRPPAIAQQKQVEIELRRLSAWAANVAALMAEQKPADRALLELATAVLRAVEGVVKPDRNNLEG